MPNPTSFATTDGARITVLERILEDGVYKRPSELNTPGSDDAYEIPFKGESLDAPLQSKSSDAITGNGEYLDSSVVGGTLGGTIDVEAQEGYYDDMMAAVLRTSWPASETVTGASDITFTTGTNTITSANATPPFTNFVAGKKFKVFLASETSIHQKEFTVLSKADDSNITTVEDITVTISNTSAQIVLMADIKVGEETRVFDFEKLIVSNEGDNFGNFPHCQVSASQLTFGSEDFVQKQFTLLGMKAPAYQATTFTDSVVLAQNKELMATTELLELNVYEFDANGGHGAVIPYTYSNLTINIDNGLREQKAPGNTYAAGIARNRLSVTLNGSIYFTDYSPQQSHLAEKKFAVEAIMRDSSGNGYILQFNQCKIDTTQANNSSVDSDVDNPFNLRAFKHPVDSTVRMFKIPSAP